MNRLRAGSPVYGRQRSGSSTGFTSPGRVSPFHHRSSSTSFTASLPGSSLDRDDLDPDPAAATTEALAKVDLSDDPDTTATAKSGSSKPRQAARGGGGDVGKSLDYLYRACRIATLAVLSVHFATSRSPASKVSIHFDAGRLQKFRSPLPLPSTLFPCASPTEI